VGGCRGNRKKGRKKKKKLRDWFSSTPLCWMKGNEGSKLLKSHTSTISKKKEDPRHQKIDTKVTAKSLGNKKGGMKQKR